MTDLSSRWKSRAPIDEMRPYGDKPVPTYRTEVSTLPQRSRQHESGLNGECMRILVSEALMEVELMGRRTVTITVTRES